MFYWHFFRANLSLFIRNLSYLAIMHWFELLISLPLILAIHDEHHGYYCCTTHLQTNITKSLFHFPSSNLSTIKVLPIEVLLLLKYTHTTDYEFYSQFLVKWFKRSKIFCNKNEKYENVRRLNYFCFLLDCLVAWKAVVFWCYHIICISLKNRYTHMSLSSIFVKRTHTCKNLIYIVLFHRLNRVFMCLFFFRSSWRSSLSLYRIGHHEFIK